jgi:hypothetical protein
MLQSRGSGSNEGGRSPLAEAVSIDFSKLWYLLWTLTKM